MRTAETVSHAKQVCDLCEWMFPAEHKWFKHFDWEKLQFRKLKPPVVPKVQSQTDTRNFFDYAEVDFGEPAPEFEHVLDDLF